MPKVTISNTSNHDQTFEVHGANNNANMTIKAHGTGAFTTPDHEQISLAVIALHDGHEGEQAEITFNGFGDNTYYDISVIVGAGGNLTIQQAGKPGTIKGDHTFMQDLRAAWKKADQHTKDSIKAFIALDKTGEVIRMGAPKNSKPLEDFVRKFANGKVYIGVGSWDGNAGNPADNAQSKGTPGGNADVSITFSDWTTPPAVHNKAVHNAPQAMAHLQQAIVQKAATPHPVGDADKGQPGVILANKSASDCTYYFFPNFWNGNGTAGANFDKPSRSITLHGHTSAFVALGADFKGRVQRGKVIPATWAEFQLEASNDKAAHGDISLEQGYDGAATIRALDGSNRSNGFTNDIMPGAPAAAIYTRKEDGKKVLASTMGNWLAGPNQAAIKWEQEKVGQKKAYITGGSGTDDVASKDKRMGIDFY